MSVKPNIQLFHSVLSTYASLWTTDHASDESSKKLPIICNFCLHFKLFLSNIPKCGRNTVLMFVCFVFFYQSVEIY